MDTAKSSKNLSDDSGIAINEKLHEWEKLENCSAPLSTFQRNACLDLGDEVIHRLYPDSVRIDFLFLLHYPRFFSTCYHCFQLTEDQHDAQESVENHENTSINTTWQVHGTRVS